MQFIGLVFIIISSLIALIDGIYIHLIELNLHANPETKYEHILHSLRALFFTILLLFLFYYKPTGYWLYFCLFIALLDFIVEVLDIREEGKSRKIFNGLSNNEYLIHALAISARSLGLGLWLSQFRGEDFLLKTSNLFVVEDPTMRAILFQLVISAVVGTLLHFFLIFMPIRLKLNFKILSCCEN